MKFSSPLSSSPASCGSPHPKPFGIFPGGQAIMSLALSAHATHKKVFAKGIGTCPEYGSVKSWDWCFMSN